MPVTNAGLALVFALVLVGCASGGGAVPRGSGIDQVPMYGGMDRQSIPELKQADERLIVGTTKEFGSRERASEAFVDQGIRYYKVDNYAGAMRRFNQAWLLNPTNPDAFWGFAIVFHDEGRNCEAKSMMERAIALNLAKPIALADAGRIYTLCAVSDKTLDAATREREFAASEALYKKASDASPNNDYVHGSWATAYYWRGDYVRAWDMVELARAQGFGVLRAVHGSTPAEDAPANSQVARELRVHGDALPMNKTGAAAPGY